jgi:lipoate-protein ligase A
MCEARHKSFVSSAFDPGFNLAFESHLIEAYDPGTWVLYLWQNERTVVIGRNQNPWKECRPDLLKADGGRLIRRMSGGGAVYHDLGNLNFTFVSKNADDQIEKNLDIIIRALKTFGIDAVFSGKNDLLVQGAKISGSAFLVEEEVLCHHGTLLVHTDLSQLGKYLTPSQEKLRSKGIDSVAARVVNLADLNPALSVPALKAAILAVFASESGANQVEEIAPPLSFLDESIAHYSSRQWNFGASPAFDARYETRFDWGEIDLCLSVTDGKISSVTLYTDANDRRFAHQVEGALSDCLFNSAAMISALNDRATGVPKHLSDVAKWFETLQIF